jgi:Peptidase family M23
MEIPNKMKVRPGPVMPVGRGSVPSGGRDARAREAEVRLTLLARVLFAYLFVPIFLIYAVWVSSPPWTSGWWETLVLMNGVAAFLFVAGGNWSWVGYPLRWFFPLALAIAAYRSAGWAGLGLSAGILALFVGCSLLAIHATAPKKEAVRLSFPLEDGLYYVVQGGQLAVLNHHHAAKPQRFALDIVRLNGWLTRCWGIYSADVHRYSIWGAEVYSPCDGVVVEAVKDLPDLAPPMRDPWNPGGNHVVIRHKETDIYVKLSHLASGSVVVKEGDRVSVGQLVGRVGNSGNTTEPHLHIHTQRGWFEDSSQRGEGVPMLFEGRFLLRNDLVRCRNARAGIGPAASP